MHERDLHLAQLKDREEVALLVRKLVGGQRRLVLAKVAAKLPHGLDTDRVPERSFCVDQTSHLPCDCCVVMLIIAVLTSAPKIILARFVWGASYFQ